MGELIVNPGGVKYLQNQVSNVASDVAYVIDGNKSSTAVASGKYVVLINSTISDRANGAYKAAKAIPANTVLDSSYLTAVSGGITNELSNKITIQEMGSGKNLNDYTAQGCYRFSGSLTNSPSGNYGLLYVETYASGSLGRQVWFPEGSDSIYVRRLNNGFQSWQELALKSEISKTDLNNSSNITWSITDCNTYYVKTGYVYDLAFDKLSAQNYTNGMLIGTVLNTNQLPGRSLYFLVIDEDTAKPINGSVFFSNSTGKLTYFGDALTNKKIRFHGTWIGQTN